MGYEIIWVLILLLLVTFICLRCCCSADFLKSRSASQPPPTTVIHAPPEETARLTVHHSGHHVHHPHPHEPMRRPSGSHGHQDRAPSAPPAADLPPSYSEAVLQAGGVPPWPQQDTLPPGSTSADHSSGATTSTGAGGVIQETARTEPSAQTEHPAPVTWT